MISRTHGYGNSYASPFETGNYYDNVSNTAEYGIMPAFWISIDDFNALKK